MEIQMEFISSAVLSGILYDMLKSGVKLTAYNIKVKLQNWIVGDSIAIEIEKELHKLQLSDDMSESAIEKKIASSNELAALVKKIKPNAIITQIHSGTGDNIAGNKIINH